MRAQPPQGHSLRSWFIGDGLSPELMAEFPGPIESVGLQVRVMIWEGEDITVRDLIDHVANVVGGVHAGKPLDAKQMKLNGLAQIASFGGMDSVIFCLRSIVLVVVEALRPLRDAIVEGS
jgi:hypothetical protein